MVIILRDVVNVICGFALQCSRTVNLIMWIVNCKPLIFVTLWQPHYLSVVVMTSGRGSTVSHLL